MRYLLILVFTTYLFASIKDNFSNNWDIFTTLFPIFLSIALVLIIIKSKKKNIEKNVVLFELNNKENKDVFEKIVHHFDLQEVFLYFFKTLNHEASYRNNIFLVRQDLLYHNDDCTTSMVPRKFYGDYSYIINAMRTAINIINRNVMGKTIFIDIKQSNLTNDKVSIQIDIGVCEDDQKELIYKLQHSNEKFVQKNFEEFFNTIDSIEGAKYTFKNAKQRQKSAICVSIPMIATQKGAPIEQNPALNVLVVHTNQEVCKALSNDFEFFNIKCFHSKGGENLISKIEDGVNCIYRVVLIDYMIFSNLASNEVERLLNAQSKYFVKIIIIINNHKNILNMDKIHDKIDFLSLPYTTDNIRSVINQAKIQHEKLGNNALFY